MENVRFFTTDRIELKEENGETYVLGYVSTSDLDIVDDIATENCQKSMFRQMKERSIKFDVEHESVRGKNDLDREINKTINPIAKVDWAGLSSDGLMAKARLNKHNSRFEEIKGSIKDGFLDAFSIAYIPTKTWHEVVDGKNVRMLDDLTLLSIAFTGNPANTKARIVDVFTKSLEDLETKPVGEYSSFEACVRANSDKRDPQAYCAEIMRATCGKDDFSARSGEDKNSTEGIMAEKIPEAKTDPKPEGKIEVKDVEQKLEGISASLKSIEDRVGALETKSAEAKSADTTAEELKALKKDFEDFKKLPQYKARAENMKPEMKGAGEEKPMTPLQLFG